MRKILAILLIALASLAIHTSPAEAWSTTGSSSTWWAGLYSDYDGQYGHRNVGTTVPVNVFGNNMLMAVGGNNAPLPTGPTGFSWFVNERLPQAWSGRYWCLGVYPGQPLSQFSVSLNLFQTAGDNDPRITPLQNVDLWSITPLSTAGWYEVCFYQRHFTTIYNGTRMVWAYWKVHGAAPSLMFYVGRFDTAVI